MKRELSHLFTAILLLCISLAAADGLNEEDRGMTTYLYGTVVDSASGDPLEGIDVWVRNESIPRNFHTNTDENGSYEVQVGGDGIFFVEASSPLHPWTSKRIEIGFFEWKEVNISLEEYEHDLYIAASSKSDLAGIEGANVSISDDNGTIALDNKYTNESGNTFFDILPGNYTYKVEAEHYQTETGEFEIKEDEAKHLYIDMDLHRADENSNITLEDNRFNVPLGSMVAYSFNSSFDTRAWMDFHSDVEVKMMEMTDTMYLYHRAEVLGENLSDYEKPPIEFDLSLGPAYGGGGDIEVWSDTYYIVFLNEEEESASVDLLIKYDYGELEPVGYEVVPLDPKDDAVEENSSGGEIPWTFIIVMGIFFVLLFLAYSFFKKDHR
ncbi:MAG: carboxypeptidase-like regulatory domain-containing protein [Thermoplasmatota archaeon]